MAASLHRTRPKQPADASAGQEEPVAITAQRDHRVDPQGATEELRRVAHEDDALGVADDVHLGDSGLVDHLLEERLEARGRLLEGAERRRDGVDNTSYPRPAAGMQAVRRTSRGAPVPAAMMTGSASGAAGAHQRAANQSHDTTNPREPGLETSSSPSTRSTKLAREYN